MELASDRPPVIDGKRISPDLWLHQLAEKRIRQGRDLKIIITAKNSETGVGKTTLAGWLALSWTKQFAGIDWHCDPENPTEGMGTLNPTEYFKIIKKVGTEWPAGTVVIVDDAEELDARRSMQELNVDFSQRWMLMRLKQAITIITLPSPSSIDSRLEELSDVWINIDRRGHALVHRNKVEDYGSRNVLTQQVHGFEYPDVSEHPELQNLRQMKEDKMDQWEDEDDEEVLDPDEAVDKFREERAQELRREKPDWTLEEIGDAVDRSQSWVSRNTSNPNQAAGD